MAGVYPSPRRSVLAALLTVVVVVAVGAACGGSSEAQLAAVEPIEKVLAGEIAVEELSTSGALVRVGTRVPLVCSVVFGKDEAYGAQSTDPEMAGLPHTDHRAPLRGLEADTVYHFRLQGTAPDGTMYVSEDLTFRTPPDDPSAGQPGTNLAGASAEARVVKASSQFGESSSWMPENAIDGDPRTEWSSAGDGDDAFIEIELAAPSDLTAIGIWTRTMGSTGQIERFRVVTESGTVLGPFELPDANEMHVFLVSARATRLRFEVVASSGGNTGAVEIGAFGGE